MSIPLELQKNTVETESPLAETLRKLEATLDERVVVPGIVEPEGVISKDGAFLGIRYDVRFGEKTMEEILDEGDVETDRPRYASVFVPDDNEKPRSYAISSDIPGDGPIRWQDGSQSATYESRPVVGKRGELEPNLDEMKDIVRMLETAPVIDAKKESEQVKGKTSRLRRFIGRNATGGKKAIR